MIYSDTMLIILISWISSWWQRGSLKTAKNKKYFNVKLELFLNLRSKELVQNILIPGSSSRIILVSTWLMQAWNTKTLILLTEHHLLTVSSSTSCDNPRGLYIQTLAQPSLNF